MTKALAIAVASIVAAAPAAAAPKAEDTASREASRRMARGRAAFQAAKSPADFEDAAKEFALAAEAAPRWPDPVFNQARALELAGDPAGARQAYQRYLELAPKAADAQAVQEKIDELEFLAEKQEKEKDAVDVEGAWAWDFNPSGEVRVELSGQELQISDPTQVLVKATLSRRSFEGRTIEGPSQGFSGRAKGTISADNRRITWRYSLENAPAGARRILDADGDGWSRDQTVLKKP